MTILEKLQADLAATSEARDAAIDVRDAKYAELDAHADALDAEKRSATVDEDVLVDLALNEGSRLTADAARLSADVDALSGRVAEVEAVAAARKVAAPSQRRIKAVETRVDAFKVSSGEARDSAMKIVEEARWMTPGEQEAAERSINKRSADFDGDNIARRVVAGESVEYREAFRKNVSGQSHLLTDDERRAELEYRAMSQTTTAGGFAIPALIDPTIITAGASLPGILPFCRTEQITNDAYRGVSAGATAWSFDAESAEVSDDASTFAQPVITAHMARGFVPYSVEIEQDYPSFASDLGVLLAEGYVNLLADKISTGTGSDMPWGVFITTTTTVDVGTDNAFTAPDLDLVWKALPEQHRANATWFMNVDVENEIRTFGSNASRFTTDQTDAGLSMLNGRPVAISDYAPEWAGTDAAKILAVGDFSKYVIAQRAGMTVETVPHLVATGANRPSLNRGLLAYARVGADKTLIDAFRVLKNITT